MYNGMYNPYSNIYSGGAQRQEVIRVNGKNGAEAYQMAPNSSVLLLDETAPIVWLKTTDGASYPSITGYQITPIEVKQPAVVDSRYEELELRINNLEKMINESKSNAKPTKVIKPTTE